MATHRSTLRSRSGTKLYAVRDESGQFKDIQSYKRAHGADMRHKSKAESTLATKVRKAASDTIKSVKGSVKGAVAAVGRTTKRAVKQVANPQPALKKAMKTATRKVTGKPAVKKTLKRVAKKAAKKSGWKPLAKKG